MLKFSNVILFQWLFCRLTRCERKVITKMDIHSVSMVSGNDVGVAGKVKESKIEYWYSIQYFILPLTGWWGKFKGSKKTKFLKVSKIRIKNGN